jgi:hypothetical protein
MKKTKNSGSSTQTNNSQNNGFETENDRDLVLHALMCSLGDRKVSNIDVYMEEEYGNTSICAVVDNVHFVIDHDISYFRTKARDILSTLYDENLESTKRVPRFGIWTICFEDEAIVFSFNGINKQLNVANKTIDEQVELLAESLIEDYFIFFDIAVDRAFPSMNRRGQYKTIFVQFEDINSIGVRLNDDYPVIVSLLSLFGICCY